MTRTPPRLALSVRTALLIAMGLLTAACSATVQVEGYDGRKQPFGAGLHAGRVAGR